MGWFSRYRLAGHGLMFLIQRILVLLIFCIPALLPNTAFADYPAEKKYYVSGMQPNYSATALEACMKKEAALKLIDPRDAYVSNTETACVIKRYQYASPDTYAISNAYFCLGVQVQTSTCAGDPPPPPCQAGCTGACGSYYSVNSTAVIAKLCISGCKYLTGDGVSTAFSSGSTTWEVQEKTGETCTTSSEPPTEPAPPSCPECDCIKAGKSYGTVNGTVVCTTLGTAGTAPAIVKSSSTTSSSGTSTDATGTPTTSGADTQQDTIRVYNGDGTVSTTSEASTTNSDGSTTTKTEAKTQSTDDFCSENPTSAACKQQSLCEETPDIPACKSFCEEYPTSITCANFESFWDEAAGLPEDGGIINQVKELTFDLVQIEGSNSCPPPVVLSFGGHSVSVSYNWLCEYAESFRPVVIAFAYLAAITIVFGAFRKGDF